MGFLSYFKKGLASKRPAGGRLAIHLEIKMVNQVLLALVISSAVYLLIDFFLLKPSQMNFLSQVATSEKVYPAFQDSQSKAAKDFSVYQQSIQKRNPFTAPGSNLPPPKEGEAAAAQPASTAPAVNQMMASLKLVGISWGEEPLAMIEDSESTRTYFVKKGGEVKGMKVQAISKEKVTLTYEGQEAELF